MFPFFPKEPSFTFQAKDVIDLLALALPNDGRILELKSTFRAKNFMLW